MEYTVLYLSQDDLGRCVQSKLAGVNSHADSKVNWANMGPIWGRQDPGDPHVGPMNFAIWADMSTHPSDNILDMSWWSSNATDFSYVSYEW